MWDKLGLEHSVGTIHQIVSKHWYVHTKFNVDTPDGGPDSYESILEETELNDVEQVQGPGSDLGTIAFERVQFQCNGKHRTWLEAHANQ